MIKLHLLRSLKESPGRKPLLSSTSPRSSQSNRTLHTAEALKNDLSAHTYVVYQEYSCSRKDQLLQDLNINLFSLIADHTKQVQMMIKFKTD